MDTDFEPKIVVFGCNWGVYSIFNEKEDFPLNIKFIKVMCGGMITPAFILRAFELGADGVLMATCHIEDCHYITGARRAVDVYESLEKLIRFLGFEPARLKLGWFSAQEIDLFEKALDEFVAVIKKLGPSPIKENIPKTPIEAGL